MFPDAFLPNLAIFLVAQAVAWTYLRTGLVPRGISVIVGTWIAADTALVARFGFDEPGFVYVASLVVMQAWTLLETGRLCRGRWRRSRAAFLVEREATYRQAFVDWLRDDLQPAAESLLRLIRVDPWDLDSRLLLAKVSAAAADIRAARRQFIAARRLDRDSRHADAIRIALARLDGEPDGSFAEESTPKPVDRPAEPKTLVGVPEAATPTQPDTEARRSGRGTPNAV